MNIGKQISYKLRAIAVIESCLTSVHFDGARNYVKNYYNLTEDCLGYQELLAHLQETRINSLTPQN